MCVQEDCEGHTWETFFFKHKNGRAILKKIGANKKFVPASKLEEPSLDGMSDQMVSIKKVAASFVSMCVVCGVPCSAHARVCLLRIRTHVLVKGVFVSLCLFAAVRHTRKGKRCAF